MAFGQCGSCAAFVDAGGGLGPCLASFIPCTSYDNRGWYTQVAWCDGCNCCSDNLEDAKKKMKRAEG